MRNIKQTDGEFWADKLMDLANFAMAGLVFSQLLTEHIYWDVMSLGFVWYFLLVVVAYYLRRR